VHHPASSPRRCTDSASSCFIGSADEPDPGLLGDPAWDVNHGALTWGRRTEADGAWVRR
jgi:hypothetical protein